MRTGNTQLFNAQCSRAEGVGGGMEKHKIKKSTKVNGDGTSISMLNVREETEESRGLGFSGGG